MRVCALKDFLGPMLTRAGGPEWYNRQMWDSETKRNGGTRDETELGPRERRINSCLYALVGAVSGGIRSFWTSL